MDLSGSHRLIHVINNCKGPRTIQIATFVVIVFCYHQVLDKHRKEKNKNFLELNSGLMAYYSFWLSHRAIDPRYIYGCIPGFI